MSFLTCALLLLIGGMGLASVIDDVVLHAESTRWSITTTTITAVGVDAVGHRGEYASIEYMPNILYEFYVDGVGYTGNTFSAPSYRTASRQAIYAQLSFYEVGQVVPVYYDPADPNKSSLTKPRLHYSTFFYAFMCLIILGIGLNLCYDSYKKFGMWK